MAVLLVADPDPLRLTLLQRSPYERITHAERFLTVDQVTLSTTAGDVTIDGRRTDKSLRIAHLGSAKILQGG